MIRINILLITNDSELPKHVKKLGSVYPVKGMPQAIKILDSEQFDLIVLGPPFGYKEKNAISHPNVFLIKEPEDLGKLFTMYKQRLQAPTSESQSEQSGQNSRKLRPLKTDLQYENAEGTVLLISTDVATIEELSCFDVKVATNLYSANLLLLNNVFKLVITDMALDKKFKPNIPTYKWEVDVISKKDVYLLLTTGRFSLETETAAKTS